MLIVLNTNEDNEEYIDLVRCDLNTLCVLKKEIMPQEIKNLLKEMYFKLYAYEKENKIFRVSKITIKKDSELGEYLSNAKYINVLNKEKTITYKKVVNAFNVAYYTNNLIYNQIGELLKNKISGTYDELVEKYDAQMLDYILANSDFGKYLKIESGTYYSNSYVVYENGEFVKRKLSDNAKGKNKIYSN